MNFYMLTSKTHCSDGGGVFVQCLQEAILPFSIQNMDQPISACCGQQSQA